jgi:hypothetical protein
VAVADPAGVEIRRFTWPGDREANKAASARAALELLLERAAAVAAGIAGPVGTAASGGAAGSGSVD